MQRSLAPQRVHELARAGALAASFKVAAEAPRFRLIAQGTRVTTTDMNATSWMEECRRLFLGCSFELASSLDPSRSISLQVARFWNAHNHVGALL